MSSPLSRADLESDFMILLPKRAEPPIRATTLIRVVQDSETKHELFESLAALVSSRGPTTIQWTNDEVGNCDAIIEIIFPSTVEQQVFRSLLVTSWKQNHPSLAPHIVEIADAIPQPMCMCSLQAESTVHSTSSVPFPAFRARASEAGYQLLWQRFLADQSYEYERSSEEEHTSKDGTEIVDEP